MFKHFLHITFAVVGVSLFASSAIAETPLPNIHEPEGEGVKCVQPEDEMRRNHMNYILHQRDKTMHEGIRTETYSLAKCIDCHVQPNEKGEIASHKSEEHFCSSCHSYASVTIDCFECHADKPQKFINRAASSEAELKTQLKAALEAKDSPSDNQRGAL